MITKERRLSHNPAAASDTGFTRLYISPLDPDLVDLVISKSVLAQARNQSYHTNQTFPEQRFGFIDLPAADAERLRNKLHGAVLKGLKLRVELAGNDDMPRPVGDAALADTTTTIKPKKLKNRDSGKKKRKRSNDEISWVELEGGRKIKRGWTSDEAQSKTSKSKRGDRKDKQDKKDKKDKKERKQAKSKYTDGPECLVKTILPANAASSSTAGSGKSKKQGKTKSREVVVHEFENSTKFATFLRPSGGPSGASANVEFVDGKGWVDGDGNTVEAVKTQSAVAAPLPKEQPSADREDSDLTSSSGSSAEDSDSETESTHGSKTAQDSLKLDSPRPKSSGSLTIKIPPATPMASKIHPLEALYKRNQEVGGNPRSPTAKPFSFGLEEGAEDVDAAGPSSQGLPPMTPFTREEFEWRNVRSAAPTPDTAHPSRSFKHWPLNGRGEEGIAEEPDEDGEAAAAAATATVNELDSTTAEGEEDTSQPAAAASDFQTWFWENRGSLNRSWKRRRKVTAKEKRNRENRSHA